MVGKIVVRNKRLFRECEIPDSFLTTKGAVLRLATFVKGQLLELPEPTLQTQSEPQIPITSKGEERDQRHDQ